MGILEKILPASVNKKILEMSAAITKFRLFLKRQSPKSLSPLEKIKAKTGFWYIFPWILGFILFSVLPLVFSLVFSFLNFKLTNPQGISFAGLANYKRLVTDQVAFRSLFLTLSYVVTWTPLAVLFPVCIAVLLHVKHLAASKVFRLLFYIPTLIPEIAVGIIMYGFFFSPSNWFYALFFKPFGVSFAEGGMIVQQLVSVIFINMSLWSVGNSILILYAARRGVPVEMYEAARVDGARPLCQFIKITLPSISPIVFYSLIINLIAAFQFFTFSYLMSGGGYDPDNAALFYNVYIYVQMFVYKDMGYASALGWLFILFVAVIVIFVFTTARKWVYYENE
ncbi:MAG: sugar ABC transporter permease [Spirochaetales bacterium]|nr:sugar ABC transporter permease [Spirochaetales bacterium]